MFYTTFEKLRVGEIPIISHKNQHGKKNEFDKKKAKIYGKIMKQVLMQKRSR